MFVAHLLSIETSKVHRKKYSALQNSSICTIVYVSINDISPATIIKQRHVPEYLEQLAQDPRV